MTMDIPPHPQERIVCSIAAAVKYGIPANIMLAVAEKEGGKAGQWVRNANGTHDVGPLQFNTTYLRQLGAAYGITPGDVAAAGCYPYDLAAWRLRMHIKQDSGDIWTRCANYHSRTRALNELYRADLVRKSARWAVWLELRFTTNTAEAGNTAMAKNYTLGPKIGRVRSPTRQPYVDHTTQVTYQPRMLIRNTQR